MGCEDIMTLEEAINTAIEYEIRIRDIYRQAQASVGDEVGRRVFDTLGNDEQHHIDYLQHTLSQLKTTGKKTISAQMSTFENIPGPNQMTSSGAIATNGTACEATR